MDFREYFEGKHITVMGLGLLGRGIGDTDFLAEMGAHLTVTDLKTEAPLAHALKHLSHHKISYVLGKHRLEDFEGKDMVLKAAGVPLDSKYIAHARTHQVPIQMSAALFAKLSGVPMIGVTGTRGKSTVTHMVHHVLLETTDAGNGGVVLGGNVRGVSNLALLRDVGSDSLGVFELDSWQLQGFGEEKISPQIGVFTSFMPDHMNYYHHDMEAYFGDKAHIFMYQDSHSAFITTREVFEYAHGYARRHGATLGGEVILTDESVVPDSLELVMPGKHNRMNAALATETLRTLSLSDEQIFAGLASFRGVPGRLQFCGERRGVKVWNDNNATTPEATVEGIRAVGEGRNVVLIMGGADKQLSLEPLIRTINTAVKEVIVLPGTGSDHFKAEVPGACMVASLEEAIIRAFNMAENGDAILFSPAFASFGLFQNEYERNDTFMELIKEHVDVAH
jgi:UDP-N-acetylmuramoylalanine--D-glutamate ligase